MNKNLIKAIEDCGLDVGDVTSILATHLAVISEGLVIMDMDGNDIDFNVEDGVIELPFTAPVLVSSNNTIKYINGSEKNYQHSPSQEYPWFAHDPGGDSFLFFKTKDEARLHSNDDIQCYLDEVWDEGVENVMVGRIHGISTKTNIQHTDEDGNEWAHCSYVCDYEIKPLV